MSDLELDDVDEVVIAGVPAPKSPVEITVLDGGLDVRPPPFTPPVEVDRYSIHSFGRPAWTSIELQKLVDAAAAVQLSAPVFGAVRFSLSVDREGIRFFGKMDVVPRDPIEIKNIARRHPLGRHYYAGEKIGVEHANTLAGAAVLNAHDPKRLVADWVRSQLHRMVTHEVDELLELDHRRVYDPHEESKP